MSVLLTPPERHWVCPNCTMTEISYEPMHVMVTKMHDCKGLGMSTPMVPEGTDCKVEAVQREDYVGAEQVQVNSDGIPIMAVVTTRDEGQDTAVYAPTATSRSE